MKKIFFNGLIITGVIFSWWPGISGKWMPTATLTVVVTNIRNLSGTLEFGIYDSKKGFPKDGREIIDGSFIVDSYNQACRFELPPGTYAVAVYHDENANGKCDRNLLGIPVEGFGFSNNINPFKKPPKFEQAKFSFKNDTTIMIKLIFKGNWRL